MNGDLAGSGGPEDRTERSLIHTEAFETEYDYLFLLQKTSIFIVSQLFLQPPNRILRLQFIYLSALNQLFGSFQRFFGHFPTLPSLYKSVFSKSIFLSN